MLICGIGLNSFTVPIYKINFSSGLVDGDDDVVNKGVHPILPIDGVGVLLGNNLSGVRVWPEPLPPMVRTSPVPNTQKDNCSTAFACAMMRVCRHNLAPLGESICSSSSSITAV